MTRGNRPCSREGSPNTKPSVLVVSGDAGLREQVTTWVEEAGYDVIMCPGPQSPGYGCIGLRGQRCPLDAVADLTVLDLHPVGSSLVDQTGRTSLVQLYQAGGRSVLVLADDQMSEPQPETAGAAFLERTADRGELLGSVAELLAPRFGVVAPVQNLPGPIAFAQGK